MLDSSDSDRRRNSFCGWSCWFDSTATTTKSIDVVKASANLNPELGRTIVALGSEPVWVRAQWSLIA